MMSGIIKEYSWVDIEKLIYKDAGVEGNERRTHCKLDIKSEVWEVIQDIPTVVQLTVYDKPFNVRTQEHSSIDVTREFT